MKNNYSFFLIQTVLILSVRDLLEHKSNKALPVKVINLTLIVLLRFLFYVAVEIRVGLMYNYLHKHILANVIPGVIKCLI